MEKVSEAELKAGGKQAPKSLRPCAADAYLLFQVLISISCEAEENLFLIRFHSMIPMLPVQIILSFFFHCHTFVNLSLWFDW